jgi:hypothetical protein
MRTNAKDFHSMRGHVADGCEIIGIDEKLYTLRNTMRGWLIYDSENKPVSENLSGAYEVECFVVYGLGI